MTTTTPSPIPDRRRRRTGGFTLVEMMVGAALSSFILAGVLSTFLFLGRSGTNVQNYSEMEAQAREALEIFAQDVRQASAITWNTSTSITLVVNSVNIQYVYDGTTTTFTRTSPTSNHLLITGITAGTFAFKAFTVAGSELPLVTSGNLATASSSTKQLQISLECSRRNVTVVAATNTVLSARFILRNKVVTA